MLLCAEGNAAENRREHCDDRCERPGHTFNLLADRKSGFCPCMIADSRDRVNRQNSPPGLEEIPTRLSQRFAPSRGIGIGCRSKLDATLSPSTSCATLFISCAPSPRLTTTGWAARAPSPPLCSNRTATARSSTRARVDDRAVAVRFEQSGGDGARAAHPVVVKRGDGAHEINSVAQDVEAERAASSFKRQPMPIPREGAKRWLSLVGISSRPGGEFCRFTRSRESAIMHGQNPDFLSGD